MRPGDTVTAGNAPSTTACRGDKSLSASFRGREIICCQYLGHSEHRVIVGAHPLPRQNSARLRNLSGGHISIRSCFRYATYKRKDSRDCSKPKRRAGERSDSCSTVGIYCGLFRAHFMLEIAHHFSVIGQKMERIA